MGAFCGALWPPLAETFRNLPASFGRLLEAVLPGSDITTPSGWIAAEMLSVVAPAGIIAIATLSAARGIAGEEDAKTLGLLLSAPVTRSTFALAKMTAMIAHVLVVMTGIAIGLTVGSLVGDLGLSAAGIVGAALHAGFLGLLFGAIAGLVAAVTGRAKSASLATAALGVLSFLIYTFAPLLDGLTSLARVSPWFYFTTAQPLRSGASPGHLLVLAAAAAVVLTATLFCYRRRDLRG